MLPPIKCAQFLKNQELLHLRFRLVHVIFGRQIIEVSTFRTSPTQKIQMSNGVLKDNEFGIIGKMMLLEEILQSMHCITTHITKK